MGYIQINSIHDLDPMKIRITDLKKKYIDREGRRYAARFNPATRSIEIVYLVSNREEAIRLRNEIRRKKRYESESLNTEPAFRYGPVWQPEEMEQRSEYSEAAEVSRTESEKYFPEQIRISEDTVENAPAHAPVRSLSSDHYDPYHYDPYYDDEHFTVGEIHNESPASDLATDQNNRPFYESRFIEETIKLLEKTNDRLFAIVTSTKKTRLFETYLQNEFFESARQIDGEARKSIEHMINYYKEITLYPRALTYYITRISEQQKARIDSMKDKDKIFEKVRRWELQKSFRETFITVRVCTEVFCNLLKNLPDEKLEALPSDQRTLIQNALTSAELVIEDCNNALRQIDYWEETHA